MCGRLNLSDLDGIRALMAQIGMPLFSVDTTPRYNVSPTATVPVLHPNSPSSTGASEPLTYSAMHWGMPVKTGSSNTPLAINARCETAQEKATFRSLLAGHRVVFPATGFYEWLNRGRERRPYYFTALDHPCLLLAGLWRKTQDGRKEAVILTTAANADMADIHSRMPLLIEPRDARSWLTDNASWDSVIKPPREGTMKRRAVSSHVNNANHEGPDCVSDADSEPHTQDLFG